jgi:hypothetical protein
MRRRFIVGFLTAVAVWTPLSVQTASAIYCYPGDPPAVYQACLAYNQGIGQQVNNEQQLQYIQWKIGSIQDPQYADRCAEDTHRADANGNR